MVLPILILVRPQIGENIGAVARAMSNFGLSELRLVAPRDGWPNSKAKKTASGAESLLKAAKVFPDFTSAVADIQLAYATTARPRDMEKRVVEPAEAMKEIVQYLSPSPLVGEGGAQRRERGLAKIALVFGPERTGLENEELTWCDTFITIPTAKNASLNLAQSAVIVGYEWWKALGAFQMPDARSQMPESGFLTSNIRHPASGGMAARSAGQGLFDQMETYLDEINYYRVADKKTVMWQNLKTMLLRARLSDQEVRTMRGMLRSLWERRVRNKPEE